jgi:hypothetical protein
VVFLAAVLARGLAGVFAAPFETDVVAADFAADLARDFVAAAPEAFAFDVGALVVLVFVDLVLVDWAAAAPVFGFAGVFRFLAAGLGLGSGSGSSKSLKGS